MSQVVKSHVSTGAAFSKASARDVRRQNNISDVIFYFSVGERSRALALLNAARDSNPGPLEYRASPLLTELLRPYFD